MPHPHVFTPTRIFPTPRSTPAGTRPIPAVLMKRPSAPPRSTTLRSPVTTSTPPSAAAARIESAILSREERANPSSMMNPQEMKRGTAPTTARSLTVPHTESFPMSPPGKKRGLTT